MKIEINKHANIFVMMILMIGLLGCNAKAGAATNSDIIRFGCPQFPGVTVKTEIVRSVLGALGYKTQVTYGANAIIYNAIGKNDLDVYLGSWLPTDRVILKRLTSTGKVVKVASNMDKAWLGLAVPEYVWHAGIHSVKDLARNPEEFDQTTIYGYGAGTSMGDKINKAISNDTFGLGHWNFSATSTAAEMAMVKRQITKHQPIVFVGWKPHWMNIAFDIKYLKDTDKIFGGKSTILTISNPQFLQKHPNIIKFLRQVKIEAEMQSRWIYNYSYQGADLAPFVRQWISKHFDVVRQWLTGVESASGKPAVPVIREAFPSADPNK